MRRCKKPGAYARFVRTAGSVNSPGATRILAIVGTGKMFFDSLNEPVTRDSKSASDLLDNSNIYEIEKVTAKPLKDGEVVPNSVEYVKGTDFELKDGNKIAWLKDNADPTSDAKAEVNNGTSEEFASSITAGVQDDYLVKDGLYRIQITYIDDAPALGAYLVVDESTEEVLGEFQVSNEPNQVIPGVTLTIPSTKIIDVDENLLVNVGDSCFIKTTGAVAKNAPEGNSAYYVSYSYKKPESEYVPKVFFDYDDIVNEFGNYDVTASGVVLNSLSLGAEIAFRNQINPVVCVQAKNDSDFEMKAAIDKLERDIPGISTVNTIVPLSSSKTVAAHAKQHIDDMSLNLIGKERMTYIAAEDGETASDSAQAADDFNNERVVYVVPGSGIKEVKNIQTGRITNRRVPGCYLAVAVAALGLKNDPAEPLTNKGISGFASLGNHYSESEKNIMAEKGCLVLEQSGFDIKVRHGITTNTNEVNDSEITLVQIKDYVIDAARQTLGALYIGRKLLPSIIGDVESTLSNILAQLRAQEVIIDYANVSVKRSSEDPRAIDVSFEIEAVYPLNFINIAFSFAGIS